MDRLYDALSCMREARVRLAPPQASEATDRFIVGVSRYSIYDSLYRLIFDAWADCLTQTTGAALHRELHRSVLASQLWVPSPEERASWLTGITLTNTSAKNLARAGILLLETTTSEHISPRTLNPAVRAIIGRLLEAAWGLDRDMSQRWWLPPHTRADLAFAQDAQYATRSELREIVSEISRRQQNVMLRDG